MISMMEILRKVEGLAIAPVSDGADQQNKVYMEELPFKVYEYETGREHNGWIIPHKWEVIKAQIFKDGKLIYDGKKHPLGVIGSSESFSGKVSFKELKEHLFYKKDAPDNIVYHCDLYYKQYLNNWGFSVPYSLYKLLEEGEYEVVLETRHTKGKMKVLEYTHKGKSEETIILNAHNCHAAQLNDGPSGIAVAIEFMKSLKKTVTNFTYKLVLAPEHIGTVFYLADLPVEILSNFKYCIFLEMLGNDQKKIAFQESFNGDTELDYATHNFLKFHNEYYSDKFRKIVGNDETVWEAAGIEIPTISLSRCESRDFYYPQYHLDSDNIQIISEKRLIESFEIISGICSTLEKNFMIKRRFTGLIALSNPKYDLYLRTNDPSIDNNITDNQLKWNYLMDCLPRYFDEKMTLLDIAIKHDLPFQEVYNYIKKFEEKGLVDFIYRHTYSPSTCLSNSKKIEGKRVYLRELEEDDASEEYCAWLNDKDVNKFLETRKSTISELKNYITLQKENPNSFFVGIFDKVNDKHIGNIKLEPIDWLNKSATFGTLIGNKSYWGKGIGTEATNLIINFAFDQLGLDEINLGVIHKNLPAIKMYEKLGFIVKQVKVNEMKHGDLLYNKIIMVKKK